MLGSSRRFARSRARAASRTASSAPSARPSTLPSTPPALSALDTTARDENEGVAPRNAPPLVDLLKLDCEGCESEVVEELRAHPALVQRIGAVTGELHGCKRKDSAESRSRCSDMHRFFRAHWSRTQNSLGLI